MDYTFAIVFVTEYDFLAAVVTIDFAAWFAEENTLVIYFVSLL